MTVDWKILGRISARVEETVHGCWQWNRRLDVCGYARMKSKHYRSVLVHRIAFEALAGPIPEGLTLDHLCRNRGCVNPDHLEPVTQQVNTKRGNSGLHQASRIHCPQGHPYDDQNTHRHHAGFRRCRECHLQQQRDRRARARLINNERETA